MFTQTLFKMSNHEQFTITPKWLDAAPSASPQPRVMTGSAQQRAPLVALPYCGEQ